MTETLSLCVILGGLISGIVSAFKDIPFVKQNPKVIAFLLSTAFPAILAGYALYSGHDVQKITEILGCISVQFMASVATHETVTHTINKVKF